MAGTTRRNRATGVLSEINITPLIDVMLVLLIIFLVVTPTAQRSLDVALPPRSEAPPVDDPPRPLVMTLEAESDGRLLVSVNRRPVAERELATTLRDLFDVAPDKTLFVQVLGSPRYGQVVEAMDTARGAGAVRIGIMPGQARL